MRIVFLANGGELALLPIRATAATHEICAIVRPHHQRPRRSRNPFRWFQRQNHDALTTWTRNQDIPILPASSGDDPRVRAQVEKLQPDAICIATFPWIVGESMLSAAPLTFNVHPSLLPRHRGINPYFWTYYHNDRTAGVTVHRATQDVDAGPIVRQAESPVTRGMRIVELHHRLSQLAARLLPEALDDLTTASPSLVAQDESLATYAPNPPPNTPMVRFDEWDVERVWHFLSGLCPAYREPLTFAGVPISYRSVTGYTSTPHGGVLGATVATAGGWDLYCRGGVVHLGAAAAGAR